jgi:Transposase DDE domain group 1
VLSGKSTLNRLELTLAGSPAAERYNKIAYSPAVIDELLVTLFLESHRKAPRSIVVDLDAMDTLLYGKPEARFFHDYYNH